MAVEMKKPDLRYAQKYVDELEAKAKPPANKGNIEGNLTALGACQSPDEQKAMMQAMLGDMSGQRVRGSRVLVATYISRQVSKGGIIYIDRRKDASRFESKVGLVIALGPTAFKYFDREGKPIEEDPADPDPKVGDWVWYRASDAPERFIKDLSCRTIDADLIEGITNNPDDIF